MKQSLGGFATGPFRKISGGKKRKPPISDLTSTGIHLVDTGFEIFLRIGSESSRDLAAKIFPFAMLYLRRFKRPPILGIHVYWEGFESDEFLNLFGPAKTPGCCTRSYRACCRGRLCVRIVNAYDPAITDRDPLQMLQVDTKIIDDKDGWKMQKNPQERV